MHKFDIAIIGGGIAGLWIARALKTRGFSVVLFSNSPLGEGQTLAAQGVIHGGAKYALAGSVTDASEQLAAMPRRWRDAFCGGGDVDLQNAAVLSDSQILWSMPGVTSQIASFFGSKLMRGRVDPLPREEWPGALQSEQYKGRVFRIDEPVVDPVSAVRELGESLGGVCYSADCELIGENGKLDRIVAQGMEIKAARYVLAAGAGNAALLKMLGMESPAMQLRPLHQIIVRGDETLPDFFSVCVGKGAKPPLVTTTHRDSRGKKLWWIGGDIAEAKGVARNSSQQIRAGKKLLIQLLPWIDWEKYEFSTARVDRAEPKPESGARPPGAYCERIGNLLVAWPTKLALAPDLADQVLEKAGIENPNHQASSQPTLSLPQPAIGRPPWDVFT